MTEFTGNARTVLITGCSSGFGLELALVFARRGDNVVATMRDPSRGTTLLERVASEMICKPEVVALDLTRPESFATVVDTTVARHGGIDVLINNAGTTTSGPLESLHRNDLQRIFDTNVIGPVALTQTVLPHMRAARSGRIVFVTALGALLNTPWMAAYCGSKHAVDSIAATLDLEVRPFGIRVSSIVPAAFRTPLALGAATAGPVPPAYRERTTSFLSGFRGRVERSDDLGPLTTAVLDVVDAADPPMRRLVAPGKEDLFGPLIAEFDARHARDVAEHC